MQANQFFYEFEFLKALLLTITIETIALIALAKFVFKEIEFRLPKLIFTGIIVSGLTLPYLWFIFPVFLHSRYLYIILGEISVVFIEAICYYFILGTNIKTSIYLSFICNTLSFGLGLII